MQHLRDSNISHWWRHVKKLSTPCRKSEWYHQFINEETPSLDNLCQKINNAFVNISSNFSPLDHCPNCPSIHVPDELLVSSNEVFCDLSRIKTRSAIGPDGIPNRVVKDFAFELAPVLADIYNSSMKQGVFPEQLKASIAIPLPKCHPPKEINSDLRPISLTNQVAKIMEGFTLKRLSGDLLPIYFQFQFAVKGNSTTQALVYLMHTVLVVARNWWLLDPAFFCRFCKGL